MRQIKAGTNESGQKLMRLLEKYFKAADRSFLYKMLRKKNILLNDHKASGKEILEAGDTITIYMADSTIEKFRGVPESVKLPSVSEPERTMFDRSVFYEDEHIILINKPAGVLSQRAKPNDLSLVELMTDHMIRNRSITASSLETFKPGIVSRLDRNTSGIVIGGKTLPALQELNELIRSHKIRKIYEAIIEGKITKHRTLNGYWRKNSESNTVTIAPKPVDGGSLVTTIISPIKTCQLPGHRSLCTVTEVEIITGKSHQIRAHMAAIGHPIIGDTKYGAREALYRRGQLLHARKIIFPADARDGLETLSYLAGNEFTAAYPKDYAASLKALEAL